MFFNLPAVLFIYLCAGYLAVPEARWRPDNQASRSSTRQAVGCAHVEVIIRNRAVCDARKSGCDGADRIWSVVTSHSRHDACLAWRWSVSDQRTTESQRKRQRAFVWISRLVSCTDESPAGLSAQTTHRRRAWQTAIKRNLSTTQIVYA